MDGANRFIEFAKRNARNPDFIICPCKQCKNFCQQDVEKLYEHLVVNGFDPTYEKWVLHGEGSSTSVQPDVSEIENLNMMYRDAYLYEDLMKKDTFEHVDEKFREKINEAETPLYPQCTKYTKMAAVVALYKHKSTHGLSDKGFSELLEIIKDMLPTPNTLPDSLYATKKFLKEFDLGYEKIDACPNDCCLFRKEYENMDKCPKCGSSRWKVNERTKKVQIGVPAKVLRSFPIIPRLRRAFRSSEKAEQIHWHSTHVSQDGKMRHPVDSLAWDTVNKKWPQFASDPRNVRLGLATDGFNPFNNIAKSYSCWPVVLTIYNLPPWLCMSEENLMLTLLIPGPKKPGNDIDIYLQPLIDDLIELWNNGVEMYDANSQSMFNLKAILLWTINDFPAYGNLAGCTTKGEFACPVCGPNTCSRWLKDSQKTVYMGHRRFLHMKHCWRDKKKSRFDGTEEMGRPPKPLNSRAILDALKNVKNDFGKRKRKRSKEIWKKKSIFFDLPYWAVSFYQPFCSFFFLLFF